MIDCFKLQLIYIALGTSISIVALGLVWDSRGAGFKVLGSGYLVAATHRHSMRVLRRSPWSTLYNSDRNCQGAIDSWNSPIPRFFRLIPIKVFYVPYFSFLNGLTKFEELSTCIGRRQETAPPLTPAYLTFAQPLHISGNKSCLYLLLSR